MEVIQFWNLVEMLGEILLMYQIENILHVFGMSNIIWSVFNLNLIVIYSKIKALFHGNMDTVITYLQALKSVHKPA